MTGPTERERRLGIAAVLTQAALLGWLGWPTRRPHPPAIAGSGRALSVLGAAASAAAARQLGTALTPLPLPADGARLRRNGAFGRVRHPIYSGLLLFAGGRAITAGSRLLPAAGLGLLLTVKAHWEERLLSERFPGYNSYAATTRRFVPRVGTPRG